MVNSIFLDFIKSITGFKTHWCFVLIFVLTGLSSYGQSSANYTFATNTTGSLAADLNTNVVDMSTGTTLLVGAGLDASSSGVIAMPDGMSFSLMGSRYTQFSTTEDGLVALGSTVAPTNTYTINGGTATSPRLAAFNADLRTGTTTGRVHFKLIGTVPNRCLVIEFRDMMLFYNEIAAAGTSTYQVRLYETTGVIEYVYGTMSVTDNATGNRAPSIGFYTGSATNAFASVNYSTNTNSVTSPYAANTAPAAVGVITNLNSTADGSRRVYRFTPALAPAAGPTALNFTAVTGFGMTLNWTAASPTTNILRYIVQRSTDGGATYPVNTNVALGTNTLAVTGLSPGTNYTYRVVAIAEALQSTAITGLQATTAGTTYFWTGATGGTFATLSNWNTMADGTGTTPISFTNIDIFVFDGAGTTAGGALTVNLGAAQNVGQIKITDGTNLTLQSDSTTTRAITINGGPGTDLDIPVGCTLNLNNLNNAAFIAFAGTGNTGNIAGTYNTAGSTSNLINTTSGTSTLVSVASTGIVNNAIVGNTGCLTGSVATLSFLAGSNYTHSSFTTSNAFIPTATWAATATATITGGTNSTGISSSSTSLGNLTINMTGLTVGFNTDFSGVTILGDLNIMSTGSGSFRLVSTGTVTVNGNVNVTGGTFPPFSSTGTVNVLGNTTISSGATLNLSLGAGSYSQRGATFTNNGTIIGTGGSALAFFSPTNAPLTFAGSGTVTTTIDRLGVQTTGGLTISHTNSVQVLRVNLFNGQITNSNKIIIGTGAALGCTIQVGATGSVAGGSFDVAPTWNLGTGTFGLIYAQTNAMYTTGFEVPPTRVVTNATVNNTNGLTIAGGNLDVTGTLTMTNGVINTSTGNILGLLGAGTLSGTPSATIMVNGPFNRTYAASRTASGTYSNATVLPVGKGTTYTPIFIDPTTTAGGSVTFTGEAFTSNAGTAGAGVTSILAPRYEAVATAGVANLTNVFIRCTNTAFTTNSKFLQSTSAAGTYEAMPVTTTFATNIVTTATAVPAASYTGFIGFGQLTPCTAPADQATALIFPVRSSTSLTGSYTAATSNPTGYLVVRTATGVAATNPVDFTTYALGTGLNGQIVFNGSALTFNETGLTPNITYNYTIFTFNNSGCAGPVYNVTAPTLASITTCATATGTPGTPTSTAVTPTSITVNWTASSTPSVNYIIDVSTNTGFTTFVPGYQALNVGAVLTTSITGLTPSTQYFVRVRADLSSCISANTSNLTLATLCNTITTFPYLESFPTYLPSCWIEGDAGNNTAGPTIFGLTVSDWTADGFLNVGTTGAAKMNIDTASGSEWLISPFFTVPASANLKYRTGATQYDGTTAPTTAWEADDFVEVLVSTSNTNWTVLRTYNSTNVPSHLGVNETIDLSAYSGQTVQFAFRAFEGTSNGSADIDFFIDNFGIESSILPITASTDTGGTVTPAGVTNVSNGGSQVYTITPSPCYTIATVLINGVNNTAAVSSGTYTFTNVTAPQTISVTFTASTTTWNGTAWSNGTPDATKGVIFSGNFTASTDLSACSVAVTGTAVVNIPSGFDFTVANEVNVASTASLTFENTANLFQTSTTATNVGKVNIKRNTEFQRLAYTNWSSPVANQNVLAFSPLTISTRFYTYNEPTNQFTEVVNPGSTNFVPAVGYTIRAPNNFADAPAAATAFVGSFTGIPNNGNYTFTGTTTGTGYNLVGNPYPSTILASSFFTANPNVSTLYFWNNTVLNAPNGDNYATRTSLTGTRATSDTGSLKVPTDFIAVGQGFHVLLNAAATINFTNAMRSTENANLFFRNANTNKSLFKLNLLSPTSTFNQIAIGYMNGATNEVDNQIDAIPFAQNSIMVSSLINNVDYVIQGRQLPFVTSDIVPLGFKTNVAGNYSFTTEAFEGVFANNQNIFLKDNLLGTVHNIKQSPYSFTTNLGTFNSRFEIVYENSILGINNPNFDANSIFVYKNENAINVNSGKILLKDVVIYDLRGRKIIEKTNINASQTQLDLNGVQQVLLVKITSVTGEVVTKKIIY